jgi:hypothetical protein
MAPRTAILTGRRAIERALETEVTPLSLRFGTDAVASVRAHAEQLLKDLAAWERGAADMRSDSDVLAQIAVERDTLPSRPAGWNS